MEIPADLKFSRDHEWARLTGSTVRIGITDYAQDALGDVVYVDLPSVGTAIEAGAPLGEVESTKSVSEIYAPVSGTIVAVNADLSGSPESINSDPYGGGWICEIEISSTSAVEELLDADAYRDLTAH